MWRRSLLTKGLGRVRYLCSPWALPYVERAVSRTRTEEFVGVEPLLLRDGRLGLGSMSKGPQGEPLRDRGADRYAGAGERLGVGRLDHRQDQPPKTTRDWGVNRSQYAVGIDSPGDFR